MKEFYDPISKIKIKYFEGDIFSVYIRRSNGRKRLVHANKNPSKIFDLYHKFKIFKKDRKYLTTTSNDKTSDLLSDIGVDLRPSLPQGRRPDDSFNYVSIPGIPRVPVTLRDDLSKLLHAQRIPGSSHKVTRNNLIPMLLAYFCDITQDEREELLNKSYDSYVVHKFKSGGNVNYHKPESIAKIDEEDLL